MNKNKLVVTASVYYNAGCWDPINGLRIWETSDELGIFLKENGFLLSMEPPEVDEHYMATAEVRYLLNEESYTSYKLMFESFIA